MIPIILLFSNLPKFQMKFSFFCRMFAVILPLLISSSSAAPDSSTMAKADWKREALELGYECTEHYPKKAFCIFRDPNECKPYWPLVKRAACPYKRKHYEKCPDINCQKVRYSPQFILENRRTCF